MKIALLCAAIFIMVVPSVLCYRYESYGQSCKREDDCGGFLACNKYKVCDCYKSKDNEFSLFFDLDDGLCYSRVEKKCRLIPAKDHETPFECLPNADCVKSSDLSSRYYGYCVCKDGYVSADGGKQCRLRVEKLILKATTANLVTVPAETPAKVDANNTYASIPMTAFENETMMVTSNSSAEGQISHNASMPVREKAFLENTTTPSSGIPSSKAMKTIRYSFAFITITIFLLAVIKIGYYAK